MFDKSIFYLLIFLRVTTLIIKKLLLIQNKILAKHSNNIKKILLYKESITELMFLFKIDASLLIKLSLISRTNLLFSFAKILNSSKDEILFFLDPKEILKYVLQTS